MVMVMMVMMMMMNPSPPSGVSAKAMLTGEEYFPASFFCLRASSSWNDDIFDTDSFLRHKMIHLLHSLSLLPDWNLLIFLTCELNYTAKLGCDNCSFLLNEHRIWVKLGIQGYML